jgi:DNA helicase II / ATP-dependent DNA helicase PcrA
MELKDYQLELKKLLENKFQSVQDEKSFTRTIHKAKGAEFNNTLVILDNSEDLEFMLNPSESNENHRIFYVAVSRAKENLFINVPFLSEEIDNQLNNFGIDSLKIPAGI